MRDQDDIEDEDTDESEPPPLWARIARVGAEWGLTLLAIAAIWITVGAMRAPALPEAAPDFTLRSTDGDVVALSALQGQTVVLNFWATWCGPCRAEIPAFSKFARNNPNIPVYGIAVDGTVGQLRSAQERLGIDYPVLVADEQVQQDYGVSTIPTTVVVGPDGSVAAAHAGIMLRPQLWWATR